MERVGNRNDIQNDEKIIHILKALLAAYVLTGGLLLVLALLLYKFAFSESFVSVIIIAIYVIAAFTAGNLAGKKMENRKFIWGLVMGCLYFGILVIVSLLVNHSLKDVATNFFSILVLCMAGGMLGGMYSNMH